MTHFQQAIKDQVDALGEKAVGLVVRRGGYTITLYPHGDDHEVEAWAAEALADDGDQGYTFIRERPTLEEAVAAVTRAVERVEYHGEDPDDVEADEADEADED